MQSHNYLNTLINFKLIIFQCIYILSNYSNVRVTILNELLIIHQCSKNTQEVSETLYILIRV